jgi:hypothetical protein
MILAVHLGMGMGDDPDESVAKSSIIQTLSRFQFENLYSGEKEATKLETYSRKIERSQVHQITLRTMKTTKTQ